MTGRQTLSLQTVASTAISVFQKNRPVAVVLILKKLDLIMLYLFIEYELIQILYAKHFRFGIERYGNDFEHDIPIYMSLQHDIYDFLF